MNSKNNGLSVPVIVTIVFVVLKLTNTIDWSWWWVFSPLLIAAALSIIVGLIGIFLFVVIGPDVLMNKFTRRSDKVFAHMDRQMRKRHQRQHMARRSASW